MGGVGGGDGAGKGLEACHAGKAEHRSTSVLLEAAGRERTWRGWHHGASEATSGPWSFVSLRLWACKIPAERRDLGEDSARGGHALSAFMSYEGATVMETEVMEGWTFMTVGTVDGGESYPSHTQLHFEKCKGNSMGKG